MEGYIDFFQKVASPFKDKNSIFITKKTGGRGGERFIQSEKKTESQFSLKMRFLKTF